MLRCHSSLLYCEVESRVPVAQTTNAHPLRTSLSDSLVYQDTNGSIGFGLFCRAGHDGHRGVACLSHCETPAGQHGNQHGELCRTPGGTVFRSAGSNWKTVM